MGAENNLGEMLSQLAIKDAGPIAELTPEQSKLVNTERCFPAIEAIVKFAQENQARHKEKDPNHKEGVDAADAATKWSDAAKGEIEGVGIARIRNIARGKTSLQNTGSMGLAAAADRKINALIDRSITQDLTEFYKATGIDSPNRIARYTDYQNIEITDIPSNHDLLVAVIKSKKEQRKGVVFNYGNSSRKTVVTAPVSLPNTICIETTIETYTTVDNGNGNSSTSVLTGQDTSFDLVCFSDAEWERAQLAVDKPDYAARYAYLQSKLTKNDRGEYALRGVEDNMKVLVNGVPTSFGGERSLRDEKLPAIVSASEGKFIAWRNPARAGQIELIPTTSKDLVERVILSGGDPSASINRLQELDNSDTVVREGMKTKSEAEDAFQHRLKVQIDTLRQVVVGRNFNIKVPTPSGMHPREAKINEVSLGTNNRIRVDMQYKSSTGGWKSIQPLVAEYPDPVVATIRTTFPQFGNSEIVFV